MASALLALDLSTDKSLRLENFFTLKAGFEIRLLAGRFLRLLFGFSVFVHAIPILPVTPE
jgi:hypothetical protein